MVARKGMPIYICGLLFMPFSNYTMRIKLNYFSSLFSYFLAAAILLILFSSCKKDPPAPTPASDAKLVISFDQGTINPALTDSVVVFFKKVNSNQPILKKLRQETGNMVTEISDLSNGDWTVEMYFYARSGRTDDVALRVYTQTKPFTLGTQRSDVSVKAPNGKLAGSWRPMVMLKDRNKELALILPFDGTDPYMEIRTPEKDRFYFYLERGAYKSANGTSETVAAYDWQCMDGCYGNSSWIINDTWLLPFAQQLQNKAWTSGFIFGIFVDKQTNEDNIFHYMYKKEWFE